MLKRSGPMPELEIGASQYLQRRELYVVDKCWALGFFHLRR
jgi:hypothetical protein